MASSKAVASHEECEKTHVELAAATEATIAAHDTFKQAVEKLLEHDLPDQMVQEIKEQLEDAKREVERFERLTEESLEKLIRSWNEIADLLRRAMSHLDYLEGKNNDFPNRVQPE